MTAVLRYLLRKFYLLCAITLITLAVLVQAGRSLSPMVNDYRQELANYISDELNARVSLGAISAEWEGLKPVLEVRDLHIVSYNDAPILSFARARLRLDLLSSLWNWHLVWGNVTLLETALEFEQRADGFWRIPGLPDDSQKTPQAAQVDVLVDMLLLANKIEFQGSRLRFRFANGQRVMLNSPSLLLENQEAFHRLSLAVDIEEREQAVSLVIEGEGDPRDQKHFRARGFLALHEFPTSEPLAAATALLLGNVSPTQLRSEGALNARLWFNTRADNDGFDISGQLGLQTLVVPLFEHSYRLDSFSTDVKGYWLRNGNWRMSLPGLSAGLQDTQIDKINFAVSGAGTRSTLQIQLDELQLSAWTTVLDQSGILREGVLQNIISRLEPSGRLRNVEFNLPLNDPAAWQLEARGEQLAVNALGGVPALTGVDGYIKAGQGGGFINLDSRNGFSIHPDPLYRDALHFSAASGQIAWRLAPEKNEIYVNSGALNLRTDTEELTGYFWLNLPWQRNTGDIDLYLHLGARNLQVKEYAKYVPSRLSESLTNWLAESIGENNSGAVTQAGFVYRGTLNTPNRMARSHQLYLDVHNAELAYHADWPALRNLEGRFLLDENNIDASITKGELYDSKILSARVATRPNPEGEGALLTINAELEGGVGDGLLILRESPLRAYVGPGLDTWKLAGSLRTDLNLTVPLVAGAAGAAQQIDLALDVSTAEIGDLRLSLQDVSGRISYDHITGLSSENLQGVLFDEPFRADLTSRRETDTEAQTVIELNGAATAASLAQWNKRPELLFLQGKLPLDAVVELTHRRRSAAGETVAAGPLSDLLVARIKVASDLTDVVVKLPEPYGKSVGRRRALNLDVEIREQTATVAVDYRADDHLLTQAKLLLQRHGNHLLNATIALGGEAQLAQEPTFLLSGYIPALALDEWRAVQKRYEEFSERLRIVRPESMGLAARTDNASGFIAGLPLRADLILGNHQLGPFTLQDLRLNAWQQDQVWHLRFANTLLTGALQLPMDRSQPMIIAVEELHLNRGLFEETESDLAEVEAELVAHIKSDRVGVNPRNLPRANVTVDSLFFDGNNYGEWSLQVHPDSKGVLFDNIHGNVHGLSVAGIQPRSSMDDEPAVAVNSRGAQIYWLQDEQGERTRFIGSLAAGDIAAVLRAWHKPDIVESTRASYQVDLTWPGAPGALALVNLNGTIDLLLEEGRFKRDVSGGDGILRLFALLNFDSIARRLRLDFSDLYKSGLTYDQVQGQVKFEDGKMYFVEPLEVEGPSSRLQLAGSINLVDETIDTRLVAALPVAGNLTFLAAFATGLPAAVGIYLVSKIFRKQVDQATSVSYSITGSWDDPQMKFDRLFESEESLRSSVNQQVQKEKQAQPTEVDHAAPVTDDALDPR